MGRGSTPTASAEALAKAEGGGGVSACRVCQKNERLFYSILHTPYSARRIEKWSVTVTDGGTIFGVGIDKNIVVASLKAVVSGVNRAVRTNA